MSIYLYIYMEFLVQGTRWTCQPPWGVPGPPSMAWAEGGDAAESGAGSDAETASAAASASAAALAGAAVTVEYVSRWIIESLRAICPTAS